MGAQVTLIAHITTRDSWQQAQSQGNYTAESLTSEGFIHCSTLVQVAATANRYYAGQRGLLLLIIDPQLTLPELLYEHSPSVDEFFPHLYGPLNLDAVVRVVAFDPDAQGQFHAPDLSDLSTETE
ncbi:MAG: DUF952 domain-containing protein [Anaerolineae bacterium]|nr:DUF952 domain-containing protein [Anaerolineae bacterium]